MSSRSFFYALWCTAVVGLFLLTAMFAWSPFAEGGGVRPHTAFYGPTHK